MESRESTTAVVENIAVEEICSIVELTDVQARPLCTTTEAVAIRVEGSTLSLIAPASLPAGYELTVNDENGKPYVVEVPEGGVRAREMFSARIVREGHASETADNNPHNIPVGQWRDECSDCCRLGCCHPLCCLSFWCTPLALGQVMTRMKLNLIGIPVHPNPNAFWTPFKQIAAIYLSFLLVFTVLKNAVDNDGSSSNGTDQNVNDPPGVAFLHTLHTTAHVIFFVYFLIALIRTRSYIRGKYKIPSLCCGTCEDFCCSLWCTPCTVCHMARHTADYSKYRASCCSDNGLTAHV